MEMYLVAILLLALPSLHSFQRQEEAENWVLLVAGSSGYDNYRHQADVCHAYHVIRSKGVPADHIIVMMYDDVANNHQNPFKGQIFNHPHGADVYKGVPIDYRAKDVSPSNFLSVLKGDKDAVKGIGSERVVQSGPKDRVFVNMVDHGAPGIFCFPHDDLHAKDFLDTIEEMHSSEKYSQMVIYMESCESGSMFADLIPSNISVYVTTAADPGESSYACYWDDVISTYLGDVYSVMWMEDSEKEDSTLETLHKQYLVVKKDTNTSHVSQYGDQKIAREVVEDFQGHLPSKNLSRKPYVPLPYAPLDSVASEDVPLAILYRRLETRSGQEADLIKAQIKNLIKERDRAEDVAKEMLRKFGESTGLEHHRLTLSRGSLTHPTCYKRLASAFRRSCFSVHDNGHARKALTVLLNVCEEGVAPEIGEHVIKQVCQELL